MVHLLVLVFHDTKIVEEKRFYVLTQKYNFIENILTKKYYIPNSNGPPYFVTNLFRLCDSKMILILRISTIFSKFLPISKAKGLRKQ